MKTMLSTGFRLTALASLGFWWFWFLGGAAYYYTVEGASLWASLLLEQASPWQCV